MQCGCRFESARITRALTEIDQGPGDASGCQKVGDPVHGITLADSSRVNLLCNEIGQFFDIIFLI